ncbi:MAG: GTP 3',8-cyclase MoaA [Chthoniobacteraceae bacterium]
MPEVHDQLHRPLRDLRISVTDRCNFRCIYCMPRELFGPDHVFLPREKIMSFEEIERLARCFVKLGVRKIRLTGGEPLLRRDLPKLVGMLAAIPGVEDLAMTTNGALLKDLAQPLKDAGLHRLTVSLDALDPGIFAEMNGTGFPVTRVLEGIEVARAAGFQPLKINAVIRRGINESEIIPLARHFTGQGDIVRFIEYMDVGNTNAWQGDQVVSGEEIRARLGEFFDLKGGTPQYIGEVASRYLDRHHGGEVGIITSVTQPFCVNCSRARLSSDGKLFTCLFSNQGHDLLNLARTTSEDALLLQEISQLWNRRDDRYSELRATVGSHGPKVEMSAIGG